MRKLKKFEFIVGLIRSNRDITFGEAFEQGQKLKPQITFSDTYFYKIKTEFLYELDFNVDSDLCFKDLTELAVDYEDGVNLIFDIEKIVKRYDSRILKQQLIKLADLYRHNRKTKPLIRSKS